MYYTSPYHQLALHTHFGCLQGYHSHRTFILPAQYHTMARYTFNIFLSYLRTPSGFSKLAIHRSNQRTCVLPLLKAVFMELLLKLVSQRLLQNVNCNQRLELVHFPHLKIKDIEWVAILRNFCVYKNVH